MLDRLSPQTIDADRDRKLCRVLADEAEQGDDTRLVTTVAWQALAASGLLAAPLPARLGGRDLGWGGTHGDLLNTLRRIGAADLSVGRLVEGHVNAVQLVRRYGSETQLATLAAAIAEGGLSGVWGAEGRVRLEARETADGWLLHGGKSLASGAGLVTHPLVPVATPAGQVLMMPRLRPGERADVSGWTAQGMRSTATGSVDLTGLVMSPEQVIGDVGDFTRQPVFSGGAWRFCAVHLGAAERLVDLLRDHLTSRGREGDPYQLQRVTQATIAVTTARFWIGEAARRLADDTASHESIVAFANLTRAVTERAALDVLELVHRGAGLTGFLRPSPIERISRDLSTYLRQPVPDLAMADAARAVLASDRLTGDLWTIPS